MPPMPGEVMMQQRSRISLFLATAGLVALSGGCGAVPKGGEGGEGTPSLEAPVPKTPDEKAPLPGAGAPRTPAHAGDEGGEGGEGGEG